MEEEEHFLFLSSRDSLKYHPSNNPIDFIIELNQNIELKGEWKIALLDLTCESDSREHLTICCDLCTPSWVDNQYLPVLRSFPVSKGRVVVRFGFPFYIKTHSISVKRFRIYIIGESNSFTSLTKEPLRCTLHLKKQ